MWSVTNWTGAFGSFVAWLIVRRWGLLSKYGVSIHYNWHSPGMVILSLKEERWFEICHRTYCGYLSKISQLINLKKSYIFALYFRFCNLLSFWRQKIHCYGLWIFLALCSWFSSPLALYTLNVVAYWLICYSISTIFRQEGDWGLWEGLCGWNHWYKDRLQNVKQHML